SAVVTLTLPLSTGLSNSFYVAVGAGGGNVTLTPQASDKINGGAAGASYVIPAGAWLLLVTDANGNFWPLIAAPLNGSATENFAMNSGTAAGSLTVGGTLSAAGEIIGTAAGTGLSITNNGTIGGALNVGGTLGVTGAVSFAGTLTGTAATFSGPVAVPVATVAGDAPQFSQIGAPVHVAVFTSSGSWTPPAGITTALVTVVAGGGGGGGGSASYGCGSGGGSGAAVYRQSVSVTPGTPETVTVGAAGTKGAAGAAGTAGGSSSFGALATAAGGGGGASPARARLSGMPMTRLGLGREGAAAVKARRGATAPPAS
ncbi:MAG: hypothetical protein B7W98_01630, partial [Parcubacteria group bacterium 20-58-5]